MGRLRIEVGDLHFSARWEPDAPQTIEAIRRMLEVGRRALWEGAQAIHISEVED